MTSKQIAFTIFMAVLVFTYEPLLFSVIEVSRGYERSFFVAYSLFLVAGLIKLSIIIQDVVDG